MSSDFKVVRNRRRKKLPNKQFICSEINTVDCFLPLEEVIRKIKLAETEVNCSSYYKGLLQTIECQVEEHNQFLEKQLVLNSGVTEIICYGLGSFTTSVDARYQFGLLLNFKKSFNCTVLIYDPIFNETELKLLSEVYDITVISEDERGKREVSSGEGVTLAYLPHCPHWLVNNFLGENWNSKLSDCFVLGNSFQEIVDNNLNKELKNKLPYLYYSAVNCVKQLNIDNSFKFNEIFHDQALHVFPKDKVDSAINFKINLDVSECN